MGSSSLIKSYVVFCCFVVSSFSHTHTHTTRLCLLQRRTSTHQLIRNIDRELWEEAPPSIFKAFNNARPPSMSLLNLKRKLEDINDDGDDRTGPTVYAIFKVGDDLRQDALVLQMLRIFDGLLWQHGLDLPMSTYGTVSTWADGGIVEVVPESMTLAGIQSKYGGANSRLVGAFAKDPITLYLRECNPTDAQVSRGRDQGRAVRQCSRALCSLFLRHAPPLTSSSVPPFLRCSVSLLSMLSLYYLSLSLPILSPLSLSLSPPAVRRRDGSLHAITRRVLRCDVFDGNR